MDVLRAIIGPDSALGGLLADVRSGRAGAVTRLVLSLAAVGVCLVPLFAVAGLIENTGGRVHDGQWALGIAATGAAWCVILFWLWSTFRRWHRAVTVGLSVVGIWVVVIPLCVMIEETIRRSEFLIGATIVAGLTATLITFVAGASAARRGKPVVDAHGQIQLACPSCGYSLVGLSACQCPECGTTFTLDALVAAQDYRRANALPPPALPEERDGPVLEVEPATDV